MSLCHRKIELVEYARTTRLLFIRLLALVKWAGSATNLTKCDVSGSVVCVIWLKCLATTAMPIFVFVVVIIQPHLNVFLVDSTIMSWENYVWWGFP